MRTGVATALNHQNIRLNNFSWYGTCFCVRNAPDLLKSKAIDLQIAVQRGVLVESEELVRQSTNSKNLILFFCRNMRGRTYVRHARPPRWISGWSGRQGSNLWLLGWRPRSLPTELPPPNKRTKCMKEIGRFPFEYREMLVTFPCNPP